MTTPLFDVLATLTLGPEDRAILVFPPGMTAEEFDETRATLDRKGFTGERVLIVSGAENVIVLRATKAEGSTVGQCDAGQRCSDDLPDAYLYCRLAHGHTGMHSDGEATWTASEEATPEGRKP